MREHDVEEPDGLEPTGRDVDGTSDGPEAATPAGPEHYCDVVTAVLDALLEQSPEHATDLGDHRWDENLSEWSEASVASRAAELSDAIGALDALDEAVLPAADRVDLDILRTAVTRQLWSLTKLRPQCSDPLVHLPGDGLYPLIARRIGEPADRLRAVLARLELVPDHLATARSVLRDMPRVHVETAILQARGSALLLGDDLDALADEAGGSHVRVDEVRSGALEALEEYARWLEAQTPVSDGDPRLGEQDFAAQLWYTLDTETGPDALLTRAESDLLAIEEQIAELASVIDGGPPRAGQVREVLDRLAASAPVTDRTILGVCERALLDVTRRVKERDLVSLPDLGVQVIEMPPSRRGVAVAYCDAPGPLEPVDPESAPTFFAVSPTPAGWDAARVASFYREYNGHMLRELTVHEAMPGHGVQLAHSAGFTGTTPVRAAIYSGAFVEGWAVYAEELVAAVGLGMDAEADAGLRMQQLKMQLRTTINAILDVRVHARGMSEAEAMALMVHRGHQEEGEAAGKWRRALLTSAQLSTYYVGYREVGDLAQQLLRARPDASLRSVHDRMLAHGSPPPRHLRALLTSE